MPHLGYLLAAVGVILFSAFLMKYYISDRFKIPAVTIYVILGVVVGISFVHLFSLQQLEELDFVSKLALGTIAFIIGSELNREVIASLGRSIISIAFLEALLAFAAVFTAINLLTDWPVYYALILGSVASATAPAATVYVIQQYRARGPLTSTIMGVVGIDDAISLIIFVFASIITGNMLQSVLTGDMVWMITRNPVDWPELLKGAAVSPVLQVAKPFLSVLFSLGIGAIAGMIYSWLMRRIRDNEIVIMAIVAFLLILLGVSELLGISELLTIMAFGAWLANTNKFITGRTKSNLESLSPLLLPLFFIFAGARLNVQLIGQIGLVGLLYTAARLAGKIGGASLGALLGKAPKTVRKWIGFALVPQVGVAVALALSVNDKFGKGDYGAVGTEMAVLVINILLFTTVFTEIVGPLLTKVALKRAKEIDGGN